MCAYHPKRKFYEHKTKRHFALPATEIRKAYLHTRRTETLNVFQDSIPIVFLAIFSCPCTYSHLVLVCLIQRWWFVCRCAALFTICHYRAHSWLKAIEFSLFFIKTSNYIWILMCVCVVVFVLFFFFFYYYVSNSFHNIHT